MTLKNNSYITQIQYFNHGYDTHGAMNTHGAMYIWHFCSDILQSIFQYGLLGVIVYFIFIRIPTII